MKLLLVDDDAFLRDMYATKFTENGDTVAVAQNGEEALRLLAGSPFDAVLMDFVMPGMTGLDLLRQIKSDGTLAAVHCIILSNQGEPADIKAAEELGAQGYIIKAKSIPSEVVTKVHTLVN